MTFTVLVLRKAGVVLVVSLLVASGCFWAVHLLPGDLALRVAAVRFSGAQPSQEMAEIVRQTYGLDRSVWIQYAEWLGRTVQLDLGKSLVTGREVVHDIRHNMHNSLRIVFWGFLAGVGLAVPVGYVCGRVANSRTDLLLTGVSAAISTIPSFLLAIFMVQVIVVDLGLATLSGMSGWARLWVLILTIALAVCGPLSRVVRAAVIDVRAQPYMMHAMMRGVPNWKLFWRHGTKNALRPILNYLPVVFMFLLYDVLVIETVFNFHGLGWALINAVKAHDIPVMQGLILLLVIFYLGTTTLTELLTWSIYRQGPVP